MKVLTRAAWGLLLLLPISLDAVGQEVVNGEKAKAFFAQFENKSPENLSVSIDRTSQDPSTPDHFDVSAGAAAAFSIKGAGLRAGVDSKGRRFLEQVARGARGMRDLDLWLLGGRDAQFSDTFPSALYANRISYLMRMPDQIRTFNGEIVDVRVDAKKYLRTIGWHLGDYHQRDGAGWSDYNPESSTWHHYYHARSDYPYDPIKLEYLGDNFQRITLSNQLTNTRTDGRHAPSQIGATDQALASFEGDRFTSLRSETRHYLRLAQSGDAEFVNSDPSRITPSLLDDGEPIWQVYGVSFWHEDDDVELVSFTPQKPNGTDTVKFFFKDPASSTAAPYVYYPVEIRNTGDTDTSYRVLTKLAPRGAPSFDPLKMDALKLFRDTNGNGKVDAGEEQLGSSTPRIPAHATLGYIAQINLKSLSAAFPKNNPVSVELHVTLNALDPSGEVSLRGATLRFVTFKTESPETKTVENLHVVSARDIDLPPNRAPTAIIRATVNGRPISSGATVTAGQEIILESLGTDPDGETNSAKEVGHRFYQPDGRSSPGAKLTYKTWREGKNSFLLHVSDGFSRAFEDFHVTVAPSTSKQSPVAKIQYPETKKIKEPGSNVTRFEEPVFPAGYPIVFSSIVGSKGSHDPDGGTPSTKQGIKRFDWDFGDGTIASDDQFPEHVYARGGTYTVKLTVTDDEGATATDTQIINARQPNRPPQPSIELVGEKNFMEFGVVEVTAASSIDPDATDDITQYVWKFEGPNGHKSLDSYVFPTGSRYLFPTWFSGGYTVTVTATDKWGAKGTASKQFSIRPWDGVYRVNAIGSQGAPGNTYVGFDLDPGIIKGWTLLHGGLGGGKSTVMGRTDDFKPVLHTAPSSHQPIRNNSLPADTPEELQGVFSSAAGAIYAGRLAVISNLPTGTYEVTAYLYDDTNAKPGTKYVVKFGGTTLELTVPENPSYKDFIVSGTVSQPANAKGNQLAVMGDADEKTPESSPLAGFTLKRVGAGNPDPRPAPPTNVRVSERR